MQTQTVLFDLDDTLIQCNIHFMETIDCFVRRMAHWFRDHALTEKQIKNKQVELDLAGIGRHGFVRERFPQSLAETYLHFCELTGRPASEDERQELLELGDSVYNQAFEPLPGMEHTLSDLAEQGHTLALFTGGDQEIQSAKVDKWRLNRFFGERILITPFKNAEALNGFLGHLRADRSRTWMIGNSARSDIVPALANGIHAIHIPCEHEWDYDDVEIPAASDSRFIRLSALREVPAAIRRYSD